MDCSVEQRESEVVALDGECTLERAVEIRSTLLDALNRGNHLTLDLRKVSAVDLSFLQLICSMHRAALNSAKEIAFGGKPSGEFLQTAMDAGFVRGSGCRKEARKCLFMEVTKR
ncbi:MAG: STAS domain-containing protein [Syntrophobacteraceae bacterium]